MENKPAAKLERPLQEFMKRASASFDISSAKLFGSYARADNRPDSDVDVAVFLNGKSGDFARTKMALADIAYDILLEYGVLIEPLPIWEHERIAPEAYTNPRLLENIAREGIRI
jgi:predicted nucleotidyltransferase